MLNRYSCIGHLGADATVRTLESGATVIGFSLAITEKWKDQQGNMQERTDWVNCSIWKQPGQSTALAPYLRKGGKVYVEGKPSARTYKTEAGDAKASLELRVDRVELLSASGQQGQAAQPQAAAPQQQAYAPVTQQAIQQQNAGYVAPQWAGSVMPGGHEDDLPF